MTTLVDNNIDGKATHVLVIGVGVYPHLMGGDGAPADTPMGLKQLGSPPKSALVFLEWVLDPGFAPPAPLGSVETLISAKPAVAVPVPGKGDVAVDPATLENIEKAFSRWRKRCDTDDDNLAVFYHCGHGVQGDDLALLAEDFGNPDYDRFWRNCYNFNKTYDAMALNEARGQYFFVDACRQVTAEVKELVDFDVAALAEPKLKGRHERNTLILYAASRDAKAHAKKNEATRFTQALMEALKGPGTERVGTGEWAVTTRSLPGAVIGKLRRTDGPSVPYQACTRDGEAAGVAVLHFVDGRPEVDVHVLPDPPLEPNRTSLEFKSLKGTISFPPAPSAWNFAIKAGEYLFEAVVDGNRVQVLPDTALITPPYWEYRNS